MRDSVAQACRAALSGDENARKCHPSVPYFTLGRRKVWVSLPKSPIHPYVILPYTLGRRKCATVLPKRVVLYSRATKSMGFVAEESPSSLRHSVLHLWASIMDRSVTQACRAALSGDEEALKCRSSVPCRTLGRRKCTKVLPKRAALHPRATKSVGFVAEESHSSLRHSALHPRATKKDGSVA